MLPSANADAPTSLSSLLLSDSTVSGTALTNVGLQGTPTVEAMDNA